jgi:hypothetical protein
MELVSGLVWAVMRLGAIVVAVVGIGSSDWQVVSAGVGALAGCLGAHLWQDLEVFLARSSSKRGEGE